ncbi:hypothetical protein BD779DRAFT_1787287 [Infundibulicybe gibba]|nr:hypothetical protein BD779DRAFT_1787287 [Infundibulicybe gibba]
MPPRKTAGSKVAGKRRRILSDDSDVEVVDANVSPRKKQATAKELTTFQEPIFNLLNQPDLSAELDALLDAAPDSQTVGNRPRPRPIRSRTKTEKGKLLTESKRDTRKATTPPVVGGFGSDDDLPEHILPVNPEPAGASTFTLALPASAPTDATQPDQGLTLLESLYDDVAVDSDGAGGADGRARCDSDLSSIDGEDAVSERLGSDNRNVNESSTDSALDVNSNALAFTEPVMVPDFQHPKLRPIYDNLPILSHFRDIVPFGGRMNTTIERADFEVVIQCLPKPTVSIVLRGLTFARSGFFVNTARVDPTCLGMEARRLVIANTSTTAVCIMIGTVLSCDLIGSYTSGPYTTHRIAILPFAQEMRRDSSVWGMKLGGWNKIVGPVESGGFGFHTRPKSNSQQWPVQCCSPNSEEDEKHNVIDQGGYPSSRSFEEGVPIYDGRAKTSLPFKFTDKDFDRLTSLPLYRNGQEDLPVDAVVAVGYTLNTYDRRYNGGSTEQLSSNVHFVILLGIKPM